MIIQTESFWGPEIPCPPKSNLTADCADSEGEGMKKAQVPVAKFGNAGWTREKVLPETVIHRQVNTKMRLRRQSSEPEEHYKFEVWRDK